MQRRIRHAGVPLYTQIARAMRADLEAGRWEVGEQLASIEQLSREYGVAISTVRQAINTLEFDGLLERVHGRGTFVRKTPREMRWLPLATTWRSLFGIFADLTPRIVLEEAAGRQPNLEARDGEPAPAYQYMRRLHERDGEPFCLIEFYLDSRIFLRAPERFRKEMVIPFLAEMNDVEMARGRQTVLIDGADREHAKFLNIDFGSPIAKVRRSICDDTGTAIYISDVVYRGDVVRLDIDLTPETLRPEEDVK